MSIAVIGGTGIYDLGARTAAMVVPTPYGDAALFPLELAGRPCYFLARHGVDHAVPPHRINYRANIWALHALGVKEVLATQAVGSVNPRMEPGDFVLVSQFIDWTKNRPSTFFDGDDDVVVHVDMTEPYCPRMTGQLLTAGEFLGERLHDGAVYACTEGPRFETAAEIRALGMLGADVVGMTSVPEVVLAREAGICYAAITIVCNWGAGMTRNPLTHQEVLGIMEEQAGAVQQMLTQYLMTHQDGVCDCARLGFGAYLPSLAL